MKTSLVFLLFLPSLFAQPQQGDVVSGQASFSTNGNQMLIRADDQTIINWDSFSVGQGEITHFINDGWVLNHVSGGQRSDILGQLTSSGQLMLLNASGLYIGDQAVIEAKSFIGSTLDTIDFQGADFLFTGEGSEIVNLGTICATDGNLYLISRLIDNQGSLEALGGEVGLATGTKVLLRREGDKYFSFEMQSTEFADPYEVAIHTSGHIEATKVEERGGRIFLVADDGCSQVTGTIAADEVGVFGDEVFVTQNAEIKALSGRVMIGGDYQGANQEVPNSLCTYVGEDVTIDVSGGEKGDAGSVIVWSDGTAEFYGAINARGGDEGGDGGFVEVSGLKSFVYRGRADRRAPFGKSGKLLLDPEADIVINAVGPTSGGSFTGSPTQFVPTLVAPVILNTNLQDELALGDVEIVTGPIVPTGGSGTVTISANVAWSANTEFAITAAQSVTVGSGFTVSNTGTGAGNAVNFVANSGGATTGTFIGIEVDGTITSVSRNIVLDGTGGDTGASNDGIEISSTGLISSTGTGTDAATITLTGTAGGGTSDGVGVTIDGTGTRLTSIDGNISITGTGAGTGTGAHGIFIDSCTVSSTGTGANAATITLMGTGSSGGTTPIGILLDGTSPTVTTADGDLSMTGLGSGTSGTGIESDFGNITSSGAGIITLNGTGGSAGANCKGIELSTSIVTTSSTGNINITGIGGGDGTADSNIGMDLRASTVESTGTGASSGTITITGTGGTGTFDNLGILLPTSFPSATVSSVDGDIILMGTGGTGTSDNEGIEIGGNDIITSIGTGVNAANISITGVGGPSGSGARGIRLASSDITSTDGTITIMGTGGGTSAVCEGVRILGDPTISSENGNISITGVGGTSAFLSPGILTSAGTIESTGMTASAATITLDGTGGGFSGSNPGISLGSSHTVTSAYGNILLTGVGDSSGSANDGVVVAGTVSSTGTGNDSATITINGTGDGTGACDAIELTSTSSVTSIDGNIALTGINNSTGATGTDGIEILGVIATTGTAMTTIDGRSSANASSSGTGVIVTSSTGDVTTVSGDIMITGTGRGGVAGNRGIEITSSGNVESTGSAAITLTGTGGSTGATNEGVYLSGVDTQIRSISSGDITMIGTGGSDTASLNYGILIEGGEVFAGGSSNITLEAGGSGVGGARGISVTGSDSSIEAVDGTISLTGDGVGDVFGHGVGILSGATVGLTGGTINFNGEGSSTGFGGRGILTTGGGTLVSSRSGSINFIGNGAGPFSAAGVSIGSVSIVETTSGGSISFTGTTDSLSDNSYGIFIGGSATVRTTGAGTLMMDGTGGSTGPSSFGVQVIEFGLVSTEGGAIDIIGRDSGGTEAGLIVNLFSDITSTSGPITLTTMSDMVIEEEGTVIGGSGLLTLRPSRDLRITGSSSGTADSGVIVGTGGLEIEAGRDVLVSGGTMGDGVIGGSIAAPAYDMVIKGGRNVEMNSPVGGGLARIFNNSTGALTLVVDNSFPTFPDFGTGAFILNSDLTANGELRIYTVEPSLNTINDTINGVAFVPGPFGEDTSTEQFSTYFPEGSYEGAAFKFYYKLPIVIPPSVVALIQEIEAYSLQIALAELADRLPIFRYMRLPNYPWHHPDFCQHNLCDPGFDPYGAFIFEDNVYWIGDQL